MTQDPSATPPVDTADAPLRIEPFDGTAAEWDAVVDAHEEGSAVHLHAWRRVLREGLGHDTRHLVARDGRGRIHGILPLVRVRSFVFGDYLVSMPFLNDGGPVGTPAAREALGAWAAGEARRLGVKLLELRSSRPVPGDLETTDRKITVKLPLPDDADTLWKDGLRAKVRSQVRRPMKVGMTARIGAGELVDPFYRVFSITMRDLGTPVLPRSFFEAICDGLGDRVIACVVDHEGEAVAAGFGFLYKGSYEITWAGALREHSRDAPNMLLYWALMEACIERGAHTFDFGRCTPGSGTHRFKKQWGGDDHPLPWAQWSPEGGGGEPPNPDSPKYRLAIDLWRRLPLGATTLLGPRLSRLLP